MLNNRIDSQPRRSDFFIPDVLRRKKTQKAHKTTSSRGWKWLLTNNIKSGKSVEELLDCWCNNFWVTCVSLLTVTHISSSQSNTSLSSYHPLLPLSYFLTELVYFHRAPFGELKLILPSHSSVIFRKMKMSNVKAALRHFCLQEGIKTQLTLHWRSH